MAKLTQCLRQDPSQDGTYDQWFRFIEDYSCRSLTRQTDRLPALAGVIAELQMATGDVCYAGHWRRHFLNSLLWCILGADIGHKRVSLGFWRAPSWSFAAVASRVSYTMYGLLARGEVCARLEECEVTPVGDSPLGELRSGYARIIAPLIQLENVRVGCGYPRLRGQLQSVGLIVFDAENSCSRISPETHLVLIINTHSGIAVTKTNAGIEMYSRIGHVAFPRHYQSQICLRLRPPNFCSVSSKTFSGR